MSTTATAGTTPVPASGPITGPGIYEMTAEDYHADPVPGGSLSSTGARRLLPPSCPAKYRYEQDHGQPHKAEFDFGTAAHKLVLGEGQELVALDFDSWRTKAVNEKADKARARGAVPLLAKDHAKVLEMADAIRRHPVAGPLFTPGSGLAERALFWQDRTTDIWRRSLVDWMKTSGPRFIAADYKTTRDASLDGVQKATAQYGYYQQAAWYLDGIQALGLGGEDAAFVFVFQEKDAPYLVTVAELDVVALRIGRALNRLALGIYAQCRETGHWPAYADDIELISLPVWVEKRFEEYA